MIKNRFLIAIAFVMLIFTSCEKKLQFDEDGVLVPLTVMEDPDISSITINGVKLHSETFGNPSDPMIVILHGGPGGDYRSMLNFKALTSDDYFVVFYDQMGSGLSQRLNKDHYTKMQQFIDELDGVIEHYRQNDTQKIVLAGHSWGAMLATAYINQKPNEIDAVILAEPGGFTWPQTEIYIKKAWKLELFTELTNDFVYQDQFITGSSHNNLDYKMALITAGIGATGDIASPAYWRYGAICNAASVNLAINNPEQMNFTTNLSNYTTKVLFAYSELNTAYGQEHAEAVSAPLPNVQLVKINACGHEIPQFGWGQFYPLIITYLNETL